MFVNEQGRTEFRGQEALETFANAIGALLRESRKLHYKTTFQDLPISVENIERDIDLHAQETMPPELKRSKIKEVGRPGKPRTREMGVKGMKWGVSKGEDEPEDPRAKKAKELGLNRPAPKNEQEQQMADIIEKSGAIWGGVGEGLVYFHDPKNNSTLAINLKKGGEVTPEKIQAELARNRKAYGIEESKKKRHLTLSKESRTFEDRLTFFVRRLQEAKRVYFARSLKRYGTNREAQDFDRLEEMFPDDDIVAIRCKLGKEGKKGKMPYYHAKVEEADVVVIQPLKGRRISSGVWSEARHAMKKRIPVKMIMPDGSLRRVKKFRFAQHPKPGSHFATAILKKKSK